MGETYMLTRGVFSRSFFVRHLHNKNKIRLAAFCFSIAAIIGLGFSIYTTQVKADDSYHPELSAGQTNNDLPNLANNLRSTVAGLLGASNIDDNIVSIDTFNTQYVSGGQMMLGGKYTWTPSSSHAGHWFVFRVNYAASTRGDVPAETIKITIPKSILNDKQGQNADYYEMSLPLRGEEDSNDEYAYYVDGDNLVIYNTKTISAVSGYFEVAYVTDDPTFNYRDMEKSDDFTAHIQAGHLEADADEKPVYINTRAEIESTSKYQPTLSRSWNNSWGERPADADDYYYVTWVVRSTIKQPVTQYYTFSLADTVSSQYGATSVVGYKFSGQSTYSTNNSITNQTKEGDRYDYVLTRHKKSDFENLT